MGYDPFVTVETVNVMVELHGGLHVVEENFTVTPLGCPDAPRVTDWLVPERCSRLTVVLIDSPVVNEPLCEVRDME